MTGVVLLHGWGLGPSTWDAWLPALGGAPVALLDAGYFGPPRLDLPPGADGWVGVGHSQGFARLAAMDIPWRGLVGLGAFLHFRPVPAHPAGTPPETLDAMLARLDENPPNGAADVLTRFRRRCGLKDFPVPALAQEGLDRLRADLAALRDLDLAATPACPTLLLHAADDRIAPVELGREAAARTPGARLVELDSGGHALPVTRADQCLPHVLEFVRGLG